MVIYNIYIYIYIYRRCYSQTGYIQIFRIFFICLIDARDHSVPSPEILDMKMIQKYVNYETSQTGHLHCARKCHAHTGYVHNRRRLYISVSCFHTGNRH